MTIVLLITGRLDNSHHKPKYSGLKYDIIAILVGSHQWLNFFCGLIST